MESFHQGLLLGIVIGCFAGTLLAGILMGTDGDIDHVRED